jgi:hypothetical protein
MAQRRLTNSERRLRRVGVEEQEDGRRGIFELFKNEEKEQADEDAPLARQNDDDHAA